MPQITSLGLNADKDASEEGYFWFRDRFGPAPGIPRATMARIDAMSDSEFVKYIHRISQESLESLMIAQDYRLRTYARWPGARRVARELAKNGFYYAPNGTGSRLSRCAFCAGSLRVDDDDDVAQLHVRYYDYCTMSMRKPCPNIPSRASSLSGPMSHVVTTIPNTPRYATVSMRRGSFKDAPDNIACIAQDLIDAGFYFTGQRDEVECFWCGGRLDDWNSNDVPVIEHCKWMPGCGYIISLHGHDFIKTSRAGFNPDTTASYLSENVDFLNDDNAVADETVDDARDTIVAIDAIDASIDAASYETIVFDAYEIAARLGVPPEVLVKVGRVVGDTDDVVLIIDVYLKLLEGKTVDELLDVYAACDSATTVQTLFDPAHRVNVSEIVSRVNRDAGASDIETDVSLVAALTCKFCDANAIVDVVALPCGHLVCCLDCRPSVKKCHTCDKRLAGTCRVFYG